MDKPNKWTIILDRYEAHGDDQGQSNEGLYAVKEIRLNGELFRCCAATLEMAAGCVVSLHLKILPRDLEIITEGEG